MDEERRSAFCWHSTPDVKVRLYDCQDPEHTTPKATASRHEHTRLETMIYWRGTGQFTVPVTDRDSDMFGGASIHDVGPCDHRHTTIEAAETCGRRLTDAAVKAWNRDHGIET